MTRPIAIILLGCAAALSRPAAAQTNTTFTFQGTLNEAGAAADGTYNIQCSLWDALAGGNQLGSTLTLNGVSVSDGLFTLELDFGAEVFDGSQRWLQIVVDGTVLSPRQPITGTPYAIQTRGIFVNDNESFVGIGRTDPITPVEIFGISKNTSDFAGMYVATSGSDGGPFYGYSAGGDVDAYTSFNGATGNWQLVNNGTARLTVGPQGYVGIGTSTPASPLHIYHAQSAGAALRVQNDGAGKAGAFIINNASNSLYAVEGLTSGTGVGVLGHTTGDGVAGYFVNRSATNTRAALYCRTDGPGLALQVDGMARVEVVEITGADVAEKFTVSEAMEPGMVVEIDPDNPGKLRVARGAYNRRVAGVVSGAGDMPVGAILGNLPGHEDAPPIALSGRVWVFCDATERAIKVGDLLTTSDTPGHAMAAADRERTSGAVIGKAMTPLARRETGLVLVLVSLQ